MTETRLIVVKARVSEIGNDRVLIHPKDDSSQSMSIPMSDIIAWGGEEKSKEEAK